MPASSEPAASTQCGGLFYASVTFTSAERLRRMLARSQSVLSLSLKSTASSAVTPCDKNLSHHPHAV
ncbi:hypothetical protein DLM45_15340 [Hyphomicrobium methylovorum]|nr:hypothetical protein [Hyphomicrobium methylovorum]